MRTNVAGYGGTTVAADPSILALSDSGDLTLEVGSGLCGKRVGMVVLSSYPADPRPRRAAEALLNEGMHLDLICEAGEKLPKREHLGGLEIIRIPIRHYRGGKTLLRLPILLLHSHVREHSCLALAPAQVRSGLHPQHARHSCLKCAAAESTWRQSDPRHARPHARTYDDDFQSQGE